MGKSQEEASGDSLWVRLVCFVDIFNMDLGSGGRAGPCGLNEAQQKVFK